MRRGQADFQWWLPLASGVEQIGHGVFGCVVRLRARAVEGAAVLGPEGDGVLASMAVGRAVRGGRRDTTRDSAAASRSWRLSSLERACCRAPSSSRIRDRMSMADMFAGSERSAEVSAQAAEARVGSAAGLAVGDGCGSGSNRRGREVSRDCRRWVGLASRPPSKVVAGVGTMGGGPWVVREKPCFARKFAMRGSGLSCTARAGRIAGSDFSCERAKAACGTHVGVERDGKGTHAGMDACWAGGSSVGVGHVGTIEMSEISRVGGVATLGPT